MGTFEPDQKNFPVSFFLKGCCDVRCIVSRAGEGSLYTLYSGRLGVIEKNCI